MATIFASMAKGKASQTTYPSLWGSFSTPPPTIFTPPPPPIPTPQQSIPLDMFNAEVDYTPDWDHVPTHWPVSSHGNPNWTTPPLPMTPPNG